VDPDDPDAITIVPEAVVGRRVYLPNGDRLEAHHVIEEALQHLMFFLILERIRGVRRRMMISGLDFPVLAEL